MHMMIVVIAELQALHMDIYKSCNTFVSLNVFCVFNAGVYVRRVVHVAVQHDTITTMPEYLSPRNKVGQGVGLRRLVFHKIQ